MAAMQSQRGDINLMISGMFYLMILWMAGEFLAELLHLPIPGNVVGMVLLTIGLNLGWIKLEAVKPACDLLTWNMAFLFVPPGVGLMLYFDLIAREWLALGLPWLISTFLVAAVAGLIQQRLGRAEA
jgi:holin-like protein